MIKKILIKVLREHFKSNKSIQFRNQLDKLENNINSFIKRNSIPDIDMEICCERCLKAYLLDLAKEKADERELLIKITKEIDEEAGHNGYYLDKNTLKPLKLK